MNGQRISKFLVILVVCSLLTTLAGIAVFPARVHAAIGTTALTADEIEIKAETPNQSAHYIVFEKRTDGTISPVYYRLVELTAPLTSLTNDQVTDELLNPTRNNELIIVSLQANNGQVVYQNVIRISPWLRGEFNGQTLEAPIDGHLISLETISFVVRIPQIDGTTLVLNNDKLQTIARFDIRKLAVETPLIEEDSSIQDDNLGMVNGSAGNRVDFLIMGDGYTSAQKTKFITDSDSMFASFFSVSPYSVYRNYINIHSLFTASSQSGADHPPYNASCGIYDPTCCGDPEMLSDPLQGKMVNTAFDSRFCVYAIHRLLAPDSAKVLAAASAVPDWDTILVLVNDDTYGGSGGLFATVSMHSLAVQVAQHEYGHSFVDLADEYESPYPGYPTCSDISGSNPCEVNVTDVTNPTQIKWKSWIKPGTPIPTPNNLFYQGIVGLFQGARYQLKGMYRSGYDCIMRSLGAPYCQIPSQSYVLTLYKGGWGVPVNGINLIEPGTNIPADPNINLTHPGTKVFHANTLSPVGGPPSQITWFKNGIPIPGENRDTYTYTTSASDPPLVHITMRVKDATTLVRYAMAGNNLRDVFTWDVHINDKSLIVSTGAQDGWILESLETSNIGGALNSTAQSLNIGDNTAKNQYLSILSFSTEDLPDSAVITKVTLRVKQQGIIGGGDPVTTFQGFMVDIMKGTFGTSVLQSSDFQTAANKTFGPFTSIPVNNWYSINLASGKAYINKLASNSGLTQMRLSFKMDDNNDSVANYLRLYSGDASIDVRPQLVVEYYVP